MFVGDALFESEQHKDERIWQEALDWLMKIVEQPNDQQLVTSLRVWIKTSEQHRRCFSQALELWELSGMIPAEHVDTLKSMLPVAMQS